MRLHRRTGLLFVLAAIGLAPALCQTTPTKPPATTGGTTPPSSGPTGGRLPTTTLPDPTSTTNTTNTNTNNTNTGQQTMPPIIIVSGQVMMDDGTPPPGNVVIERVCGASTFPEGYADPSGYFSLQLGQHQTIVEDASDDMSRSARLSTLGPVSTTSTTKSGGQTMGLPNDRYSNCDLRARLGGYRSQSVSLVGHGPMDNPNIGTILLHRLGGGESGTTVTATSLKASKPAHKAFQKGMEQLKKSQSGEAMNSFREAVKSQPDYAEAWVELGKLQRSQNQNDEARHSFEEAAKSEPRWPVPLLHLSLIAAKDRDWPGVANLTNELLRLNSFDYPQAFFLNGVANFNLRHVDIAEKAARSAQRLDTQHQFPEISHLMGVIYLEHHQYAEAAIAIQDYLTKMPQAEDSAVARKQLADAERLAASASADHKDQ